MLLFLVFSHVARCEGDSLSLPFNLKHLSAKEQANILNDLSIRLIWQNPSRVAKYAESALSKSRSIGHLGGIGKSYHNLGNAALFLGEFYKSLEYYQQAQFYYDSAGLERLSFGLKGDIAEVYAEINDFARSEELLVEVIPEQKEEEDTLNWAISLRRYALLLSNQGKYQEAIERLGKSLKLMTGLSDTIGIGLAHSDLGGVYIEVRDYKSASEHLSEAAHLLKDKKLDMAFMQNENRIGKLLIASWQFDEAILHLEEGLKRALKVNARPRILEAYHLLSDAYRKKKEFEKALIFHEKFAHLKDSILSIQKSEQISALQVKYEAKTQQLELEEFRNDAQVQKLKIWFLIIFLVVSASLLGVWLINKKKAETQLKAQFAEIEKKNQLIKLKHEQIEEANKELKKAQSTIAEQNAKLIDVNMGLEEKVKQRTTELSSAVQRLTATNQELDSLIFHSSHSLKSPLTSLKGLSMLGNMEAKEQHAKLYFGKIEEESEIMLRLQKNLMLIHEVKNQSFDKQRVSLPELIKALQKKYKTYIEKYSAEISIDIPQNLVLNTQPEWVMSILKNMVENSVFFSRFGETPKISVKALSDGKVCQIHIRDNGKGIPKETRANIFEMFFRGDSASGGSGLGLYVGKLAAERLGGKIQLMDSSEARGTHFCIYLPVK